MDPEDPCHQLKSGDRVIYKNKEYYFRPNGSVGILYATEQDYIDRNRILYVDRSKLKLKEPASLRVEEDFSEDISSFVPMSESEYADMISKLGLLDLGDGVLVNKSKNNNN